MTGLVELARRYVALNDELESVRELIKRAVVNGAESMENPTRAERPGAKGPSHPNAIAAAAAERKIIELLQQSPGMGTAAVARAMGARTNTTAERLKRLRAKGLTVGGGSGGWTASP
jgi:DNA-binding NtrC family response regulator